MKTVPMNSLPIKSRAMTRRALTSAAMPPPIHKAAALLPSARHGNHA